jgi:hypothetical protein
MGGFGNPIMKKAALGLIAVVLASGIAVVPLHVRGFDPGAAGEWANAVAGVLAANAHGYGPGYNYSPGYAFVRGPDLAVLAMVLRGPDGSAPGLKANDTVIAQAQWPDQRAQPTSY